MKRKLIACFIILGFVFLGAFYRANAENGGSNSAIDDLQDVYQDTSVFDGGPGSTINTSPAAEDYRSGRDPYQVPDVGDGVPVE